MPQFENVFGAVRHDIAIFRAVLNAGLEPSEMILHSIWDWHSGVELILPLPVMTLGAEERRSLALGILEDMDALYAGLEAQAIQENVEDLERTDPTASQLDALWRELAGCFAELVNDQVDELDEEEREDAYEHLVEAVAEAHDVPEEDVRKEIKTDPEVRMQLRLQGLDPDKVR